MARYGLDKVVCGLITQCEPLGYSGDIEALKEFADDELIAANSHRWTGKWRELPKEQAVVTRGWKSYSGRHGGFYRIRCMSKNPFLLN